MAKADQHSASRIHLPKALILLKIEWSNIQSELFVDVNFWPYVYSF